MDDTIISYGVTVPQNRFLALHEFKTPPPNLLPELIPRGAPGGVEDHPIREKPAVFFNRFILESDVLDEVAERHEDG